jgi:YD repeat-containing protein
VFWTANDADAELHLTSETAGNGVVTSTAYNANNGLIQSIQAGTSNAVANFTCNFDTQGDLTSRIDATQGLTEAFSYDLLHRLTSYQGKRPVSLPR